MSVVEIADTLVAIEVVTVDTNPVQYNDVVNGKSTVTVDNWTAASVVDQNDHADCFRECYVDNW
jgi:hypothetical protein